MTLLLMLSTRFGDPVVSAEDALPGPIPAELVRVIDGDSIYVRADIWPGQVVSVNVRLSGIDTAEKRARCEAARHFAAQAEALTVAATKLGSLRLYDVRFGKYAGRVVARVETVGGVDLASALIDAGLALPYENGPRPDWCVGD